MLDDRTRKPSQAQIKAGNYPKDHVNAHGMRISIENPAGSVHSGTDKDGTEWSSRLQHDYGYVRGTRGADKDHIDVFLGPQYKDRSLPVHVVDQHDPDTGKFDEHKAMLGFPSQEEAMAAYHANYPADWAGARAVTPLHVDAFKAWATSPGARKTPLAGDASVQRDSEELPAYAEGGSIGGFLSDPENYKGMARNLGALVNRNLIGMGGMPVDLINWATGHAGGAEPVGGSDWLKRKAAGLGMATSSGNSEADNWGDAAAGLLSSPEALRTAAGLAARGGQALAGHAGQVLDDAMHGSGPLATALAPSAPAFAVKPKGGNWAPERLEGYVDQVGNGGGMDPTHPVQQWKTKQLQNYFKNQMGTTDDPLLKLEAQGQLHIKSEDLLERSANRGITSRSQMRGNQEVFPVNRNPHDTSSQFHRDATGRNYRTPWENLSDAQFYKENPAKVLQDMESQHLWTPEGDSSTSFAQVAQRLKDDEVSEGEIAGLTKQYGWLDKVDPKTPIWSLQNPGGDALGFGHVLDYLNAATRAHGLNAAGMLEPGAGEMGGMVARGLHLSPEQLGRTSVGDAVAKTGQWNTMMEELANLKSAQAQAANPATVLHKAYPGTPYSWQQLKMPDSTMPPGSIVESTNPQFGAPFEFQAPDGTVLRRERTREALEQGLAGDAAGGNRRSLQDALTYEGGQMGHCVGGYCDPVANGTTQIYSLRDQSGKPHVTIETRSGITPPAGTKPWEELDPAVQADMTARGLQPGAGEEGTMFDDTGRRYLSKPPSIVQIKGRFNGNPAADTLPMVQDFVKSGNWSQVGDLENSGLRKTTDAFNSAEHDKIREAGIDLQQYHTPEELQAIGQQVWPGNYDVNMPPTPEGYASGGSVVSESAPGTQVLAPLGGWGWGYMNGSTSGSSGPSTAADFALPTVTAGGHSTADVTGGGYGVTPSGNPGAGTGTAGDLSKAAAWAGLAAQATKDAQLGQIAGLVGTAADTSAGQYGALGSTLGRMVSNTPAGGLVGSLAGQAASDGGINGRNIANTVVSAVPGLGQLYGAANFFSGGDLGKSLFGSDIAPTASGGYTPAQPGIFGNFGLQSTPQKDASDAAAAANNPNYGNEGRTSAPTGGDAPSNPGTSMNAGKQADDHVAGENSAGE